RSFSMRKAGVLSVTATDTAVLCGAKHDACIKNYGSVPLNNEFCHENAIRILLSFIARAASQFNFAIRPLVCFSKRHYVKCILRLEFGAGQAVESAKLANYFVLYCPGCLERKLVKATGLIGNSGLFGEGNKCRACGHVLQIAGPLWAGKLAEKEFVQKMAGLNAKRGLECWEEVAMLLDVLENEADMPAFSYDLHRIFKVKRLGSVPNLDVIEMLKKDGYAASLTQLFPNVHKTDAPAAQVVRAVGMLGKKAGK
ncbi:hypothetical protein FJZ26_03090, partial [Candidatus Parvarchaeota archaeon]|nr:hypothetical protein [Candidatus Parvarchaeota archaeon]